MPAALLNTRRRPAPRFVPTLDGLDVWDDTEASVQRKMRMWGCLDPRGFVPLFSIPMWPAPVSPAPRRSTSTRRRPWAGLPKYKVKSGLCTPVFHPELIPKSSCLPNYFKKKPSAKKLLSAVCQSTRFGHLSTRFAHC